MIKNIIFDIGQVLVHFEPEYMVRQYVTDEKDIALLKEVVFDRLYWDRLDLGTITDEETVSLCRQRLPKRLWDVAEKIHMNWIYNIPEMEGMAELIKDIKKRHRVGTFALSNISHYFADHMDDVKILSLLDGHVFSARIGITKPDFRIIDYICEKYNLDPATTLFVDDSEKNVNAGRAYGLTCYQFDGDADKLKKFIENSVI